MSSGSVNIDGYEVWYEMFGTGSHPILLIPGAIGTGRTDFGPQIQGPNALDLNKFTLVAMEPLGWGRSRPPVRKYDSEMYIKDAFCGNKIMEALGFSTYSLIGWSDGAITAILMANQYKKQIRSCIVWSIATYASKQDMDDFLFTNNIKFLGKDLIENYESVYGNQWIKLWTKHMEFLENTVFMFPNRITEKELKEILCPLLVLHGDQDPVVDVEHPLYVTKNVSDVRLHRFPNGSHNLHFSFANDFKKIVEDFTEEIDYGYYLSVYNRAVN